MALLPVALPVWESLLNKDLLALEFVGLGILRKVNPQTSPVHFLLERLALRYKYCR
jgi:hypothetical protein